MNSAAVAAHWSQIIVTFSPPQLKTPTMILLTAWCYTKKERGKEEPLRDFAASSFFLPSQSQHKTDAKTMRDCFRFSCDDYPTTGSREAFQNNCPHGCCNIRRYSTPLPRYGDLQQTSRYPWPSPASDYRRASQWQQVWTLLLLLSHTNMFTFCSVREILIQSQYLRQQERSN